MKRALSLIGALAFLAGCSGMGSGANRFLPGISGDVSPTAFTPDRHREMLHVAVTMRIPRRHRGERASKHPSTISSLTESVSIAVNGAAPKFFSTTTTSPNCTAATAGLACTFAVSAPAGTDTFVISTYAGTGGTGTVLDRGTAVIAIAKGKNNSPHINLGPVVSMTADTGLGSLRYAIAAANPGDTIVFTLPAGSTITLASRLQILNNVTIAGPGVSASVRPHRTRRGFKSRLTFGGVTISGAGAQQLFFIAPGATVAVSGLILTQGLAHTTNEPGGAIYNEGTLTLSNTALTDNDSHVFTNLARVHQVQRLDGLHPHCAGTYYQGGAVYNHGLLTVTGSWFDSNVLTNNFFGGPCQYSRGGAIYNDEYGTLLSSGNTYTNNSAWQGGAVYNNSTYGQASFSSDHFTGNYGCISATGCTPGTCSGGGCGAYNEGFGGAIFDANGPGITVTSSAFFGNYTGAVSALASAGDGGALDLQAGSPSITGSSFTNNFAGGGTTNCSTGYGGAIFESASGQMELDNDTFTNNEASGDRDGYGGAIYSQSVPDHGSGNTFTGNVASASGTANCYTGNGSSSAFLGHAQGGAIYSGFGITMSGSSFTGNSASCNFQCYGGAIYENDPSNLSGDTFSSNTVSSSGANGSTNSESFGGAIDGVGLLRLTGNTFTSNMATANGTDATVAYGGAVYVSGTTSSTGNSFSTNKASAPTATSTSATAAGGGIYANSTFASNGDRFTSNNAVTPNGYSYGGGIAVNNAAGIVHDAFTSNSVTGTGTNEYARGGGLAILNGNPSTISNSTFTGNSTAGTATSPYNNAGGGVYDAGCSNLDGLTVTGNTANGAGGGIYGDSCLDNITASTISGNSVTSTGSQGGGGGVYANFGVLMTDSTVSGNTAAVNGSDTGGGGFFNYCSATIVTGTTISGNGVTGPSGTHVGGGGVFNDDSGTYANDTITSNTSSADGGGFEEGGNYTALLNNVTLYANTAVGKGGNVFNDNNSSPYVTFANTIVAGGTSTAASAGGDVENTGGTVASNGYNIIGMGVDAGTFAPQTGDQIGTTASPINPKVLALSNNGGPTSTRADQAFGVSPGTQAIPYNPALQACGNVTGMGTDQRGFARGAGLKCDVGAYEFNGAPSAIHIHLQHSRAVRHHGHPGEYSKAPPGLPPPT